jgi:4-amino-4-deoxy-L-arabinose transferase-like glycosyltransferase
VVLAASAVVAACVGVLRALGLQDAEALESPLIMSVARQLVKGPWELYGPFGGRNPLVLIHAPLYYHLSALVAWPMASAGLHPVAAALVAGRSLSMLGLAVTLTAAYRLARLDGSRARAGWSAVFLITSASVVGVIPFAVRPDMLGIALQTTGVLLVLSVLGSERSRGTALPAAFALFGLAICIKQHFLVGPLASTYLLLAAWRRGQVALRAIVSGLVTAVAVVLVIYGTEELVTGGHMSQAVFLAAANSVRFHAADGSYTGILLFGIIVRSSGPIALMAISSLAMVSVDANVGRRAFVAAGTVLVGLMFVLVTLSVVVTSKWLSVYSFGADLVAVAIVLPICAFLEPRSRGRGWLDRALCCYLCGELALLLVLSRTSTGAWVNYAIPATVFACILTARALDHALVGALEPGRLLPIALAASIPLASALSDTYWAVRMSGRERLAIAELFRAVGRPSSEFFFLDRPGDNRLYGQLDLVYDNWLYPVFESIQLAEPRSSWLRHVLMAGPVRFVVSTSESERIDGLDLTLPQLGYSRRIEVGPFFVWERIGPPTGLRPSTRNEIP